jgi:signal peptidase
MSIIEAASSHDSTPPRTMSAAPGASPPGARSRLFAWLMGVGAVSVMVPICAVVVAAWVWGWQLRPLESGSMEPAFRTGSLMVVTPVAIREISEGSVIVFEDPQIDGRLVSHRVVTVERGTEGGVMFRTKGDANLKADPEPVPAANVRGEVRWAVPGLGRAANLLQWPANLAVFVGIPAALLVLTELRARRGARRSPPCETCGQPLKQ